MEGDNRKAGTVRARKVRGVDVVKTVDKVDKVS